MWKNCLRLFFISLILVLASCARPKIQPPSYEGVDFQDYLAGLKNISEIRTKVSLVLEKSDSVMRGDGALDITAAGDLSLRIYSLGFLAMELTSKDGIVRSDPPLDRNKTFLLTKGLRDCVFWWEMKDYSVSQENGNFVLVAPDRIVWVDRKTFLPLKEKLYFGDRVLSVSYEEPAKENDVWYQSKMRIELGQNRLTVTVKEISFNSGMAAQ